MANRLAILRVSVDHSSVDYSDLKDPKNTDPETLDDLKDTVLTGISGAGLSSNFDIVSVTKIPTGINKTSYEIWVQGTI